MSTKSLDGDYLDPFSNDVGILKHFLNDVAREQFGGKTQFCRTHNYNRYYMI